MIHTFWKKATFRRQANLGKVSTYSNFWVKMKNITRNSEYTFGALVAQIIVLVSSFPSKKKTKENWWKSINWELRISMHCWNLPALHRKRKWTKNPVNYQCVHIPRAAGRALKQCSVMQNSATCIVAALMACPDKSWPNNTVCFSVASWATLVK